MATKPPKATLPGGVLYSYAVIQTVAPYHPQGDPTRPETTEFIHWIFDTKKAADSHMKDLLLTAGGSSKFEVRKVSEEPWTSSLSAKKEEKK